MSLVTLDWSEYPPPTFLAGAVTVGNFDGVHLGHRALMAAARARAERLGGPAVAVTFDPPPHQVLHTGPARLPLSALPERAELLHAAGADHIAILRTSPALLSLSPEAFFEDVLIQKLNARAIVEGHDFRFGRGRAGTNASLRDLCLPRQVEFEEIPPVMYLNEPVSSSRIRAAMTRGDVALVAALLARTYRIRGIVVDGARRGRTIGFPTANLADVPTMLPGNGVYAVRAIFDGRTYAAAANIGPNPTFGEDAQKIEVHLIGFSGDLYGKTLAIEFVARLRDTRPFAGANELIQQLCQDIAAARDVLGS